MRFASYVEVTLK